LNAAYYPCCLSVPKTANVHGTPGSGPGASWRDLPGRYGPWTTCHERYVNRLKQWMTLGLLGQVDAVGTRNNALW
jgi:hypothetical protein